MYTYQIEFLKHDEDQELCEIRWNCSCNDPETTLMLAKGDCKRLNLDFAVIRILKENGNFVSMHVFDIRRENFEIRVH